MSKISFFLLAIYLSIKSSFITANTIIDQKYFELNKFNLETLAYCSGFINGSETIVEMLLDQFDEELKNIYPEIEVDEQYEFHENLVVFKEKIDEKFKTEMYAQCGDPNNCSDEIKSKAEKGFKEGYELIFKFYDLYENKNDVESNNYIDLSDDIIASCFKKFE